MATHLTYSHKVFLWKLAEYPGILIERPGFNSRATVLSLAQRGLVRLDPPEHIITEPYNPKAYLTETGLQWVMEHPDRTKAR